MAQANKCFIGLVNPSLELDGPVTWSVISDRQLTMTNEPLDLESFS